jgi:hypothetical protein
MIGRSPGYRDNALFCAYFDEKGGLLKFGHENWVLFLNMEIS